MEEWIKFTSSPPSSTPPFLSVNWSTPYQTQRNRFWSQIDHFFNTLPPPLYQQAVLLKNNLATFFSTTGQFHDILSRERDHPLLYWHGWLLADLGCPETPENAHLEQALFLAMFFNFAAVYTRESMLDETTNFDQTFTFLAHTLSQQADFYLAHLFPATSPFWAYRQACWADYSVAKLAGADRATSTGRLFSPSTYRTLAAELAFTKISLAAVAVSIGRTDLWPQLDALVERLNGALHLLHQIATLRRDLFQHRSTYPIQKTCQLTGLDPTQALTPERLLGALVLSGAVPQVCQEALTWLAEGMAIAQELKLAHFLDYMAGVEAWLNEVQALFSLKSKNTPARTAPLFAPAVDTLPKVISMAQAYLLADLSFAESWEVQRRGLFGVSAITGKAFPMALVAEVLAQHGHNMAEPINVIFQTLHATGWRYYDHPHLPPDSDDLALALRLYPYSAQPEQHATLLQTPLAWLRDNLGPQGEIPVWLTRFEAADKQEYPFAALWGYRCAAVEANLLLGLLAYDRPGYSQLIAAAGQNWLERWRLHGLAATHHYVPLYALWTALELLAKLDLLDQTPATIIEQMSACAQQPHLSPQSAAFLSLACHIPGAPEPIKALFKPEWMIQLGKTQRYDGSWADEPLYGTPTRGELAAWYSSRTVTTAFCYHALRRFQKIERR